MPDTSDVKSEYSAGGVVYRHNGKGYEIAVVSRPRHTDWSLPKGHLEAGETREQAAIREVKEETGLDARIVGELGEVVYFFSKPKGGRVRKSVFHYLMEATSNTLGGPNWEVAEVRMVPISEVYTLLSYENDRTIVRKAQAALEAGS